MKKIWNFIRKNLTLLIILAILVAGSVYYLYIHRNPFTQNAYIIADIRPITALVPGHITHIYVKNNQFVKQGEMLFSVFKPPYALKVKQLQSQVEAERFTYKAIEFKIEETRALIKQRVAELENAKYLSIQANEMYKGEATSQKNAEIRKSNLLVTEAALHQSEAQLKSLEQQLSSTDAMIKSTTHELGIAEIYLEQTDVFAFHDGFINNMHLSPGTYVNAGEVLFAFVNSGEYWVQANLEETELALVAEGQTADIYLWQYPGQVFKGVVDKKNWNVSRNITSNNGLQYVEKENEWFLLPQRFPVQIKMVDVPENYQLHNGGSAYVKIHTSSLIFRNFIWRLFMI